MKRNKNLYTKISFVIFLSIIFQILSNIAIGKVYAAPIENYSLRMKLSKANISKESFLPTDKICTILTYSLSGTSNNNDLSIKYDIPNNMEYLGVERSKDIKDIDLKNNNDGSTTLYINFVDRLQSGTTGLIKIITKFKSGIVNNGEEGCQTAKFIGKSYNDGKVIEAEDKIQYKAIVKDPDWTIKSEKESPSIDPVLGETVLYKIAINGNNKDSVNINSLDVDYKLPDGAVYISSNFEGNYNKEENKVTWNIANLKIGENRDLYVKVRYPKEKFNEGNRIINNITAIASMNGYKSQKKDVSLNHSFEKPIKKVEGIKNFSRVDSDEYSIGQTVKYYINGFSNKGNIPLNKFIVEDIIPREIDLTKISLGQYNQDVAVNVRYKTNKRDYFIEWDRIENPNNKELLVKDLVINGKLEKDEYITTIQFDFGRGINPNFGLKKESNITIEGNILDKDRDDKKIENNSLVNNIATFYWDEGKIDSNCNIKVVSAKGNLNPKVITNKKSVGYEDNINYVLKIQNDKFATGDIIAPIGIFIVPEELAIGEGKKGDNTVVKPKDIKWNISGKTMYCNLTKNGPAYKVKKVKIDGKVRTALVWKFNSNVVLKPGEYIDIKFNSKIKSKTLAGVFKNDFYISASNTSNLKNEDNLDNNINSIMDFYGSNHKIKKTSSKIFVKFQGSIKAEGLVKGSLDKEWIRSNKISVSNSPISKYGTSGQTLIGKKSDYLIRINTNDINAPVSNLVVVDKLPRINDTEVIGKEKRESKWTPYLVDKVEILKLNNENNLEEIKNDEIKIYYSTSNDISKEQLNNNSVKTQISDWNEEPPKDLTKVTAIKVNFNNYKINPRTNLFIKWSMEAPDKAPENEIAWNSFGYNATVAINEGNNINQFKLQPSEPMKTGLKVTNNDDYKQDIDNIEPIKIGDYVWNDSNSNGIQDEAEEGLEGVKVRLYKDGNFIEDTKTNKLGKYEFTKLKPGKYRLEFIAPNNNYSPTIYRSKYVGKNSVINSDGKTKEYELEAGETKSNIDAGFHKGRIEGIVWDDLNYNGFRENNESGIRDINIQLLNEKNEIISNTKTNKDGMYYFNNLESGKYHIKVEKPIDYDEFTIESKDKKENVSKINKDGITKEIIIENGAIADNINAGLTVQSAIGNTVWEDINYNGIREENEPGIHGVNVHLLDENKNEIKSTITDKNGEYKFTNLQRGVYYVKVDLKDGYSNFSKKTLKSEGKMVNCINSDGITDAIKLPRQTIDFSIDVGMIKLTKIKSFVWYDKNSNGVRDDDDITIKNTKIELYKKEGADINLLSDTKTDEKGQYEFNNLMPGEYYLKVDKNEDNIVKTENTINHYDKNKIKIYSGENVETSTSYFAVVDTTKGSSIKIENQEESSVDKKEKASNENRKNINLLSKKADDKSQIAISKKSIEYIIILLFLVVSVLTSINSFKNKENNK